MGYKRDKLLKLTFEEGHELHGLEVYIKPAKLKLITALSKIDKTKDSLNDLICEACQKEEYDNCTGGILESFANYLQSWNLEDDDDNPVPTDLVSILDQDIVMVMHLMDAWAEATGSIPENLSRKLSNGAASPEQSELTALLSQSQQPLLRQN